MKRLLVCLLLCLPRLVMAEEPEVRVQNRLAPADSVMVGGTINLEVDLLVDTWFTAAPILPKLELPGAVVNPPSGEAQHLTEQQDGKTFFGLRFIYQITPQAAQRFEIPALEFQVQPGQASGPVKVRSQPLAFAAKELAGESDGHRLVATSVTFTQEIERSHDPLRVGDSITRRVKVQAEGAQAMLLPPPEFVEVNGLKRYVQTPRVTPLSDGRGGTLGGVREDSVTYVIGEAGEIDLPAIELKWWDVATGEGHSAAVPTVELKAAKGDYQAPFSISEDLRALGQKTRLRLSGHGMLLGMFLVLGGGLAYLGRPWGRVALALLRRWREARKRAWLESPDYAWKLARQQLKGRPTQLGGLYLWVRRSTGNRTLSEFSDTSCDAFSDRLLGFFKSRYGAASVPSQAPADLRRVLPDVRRAVSVRKKVRPEGHGLKPLNP
ncbi:hypothetical protein PSH28_19485 [Pseudomonas resinovorans]|uniref:hypothetical protein n=1 Tax=Metapseudomonas resinovorans TaxID=53412 RepID=UPI00237EFD25|nr:hypothetical protein [Pseudomonas resinovorans]MDE3738790.1 hypothetical protein [Pseudomonas resinovorans]